MPKIKLTKGELKVQRDALKQFLRFLPILQLKKQQLQLEAQQTQERIAKNEQKEMELKRNIFSWVSMFGNLEEAEKIPRFIHIRSIDTSSINVAGIAIPVYIGTSFKIDDYDLFNEPPWLDDAVQAVCDLIEIREEKDILTEQYNRIRGELRTTTQRVNLFEKVKIPACKENIRKIQIYLGDQVTSAVGRSKIAKSKLAEAIL